MLSEIKNSPLYSKDLAPLDPEGRTWGKWHLVAIWIGMAVCIPTYLLASYMIKTGLNWYEALFIVGLANLIITVPMVLNGHAGVKYGIPFPVIGRAAFGTKGVHIASVTRGLIACGWFGVQTWVGGLAIYAIFNAISDTPGELGLSIGKFISFFIFWVINVYFIQRGTESIKWLEAFSAPILISIGVLLIFWGTSKAGSFSTVLDQSKQLSIPAATIKKNEHGFLLELNPLKNKAGIAKADEYRLLTQSSKNAIWQKLTDKPVNVYTNRFQVQFKKTMAGKVMLSSIIDPIEIDNQESESKLWLYILWLTAMVGFWATMAISISDITRYAKNQKDQVFGQFVGLPGTMLLYSFVGIFVTCSAVINFQDILIANDAPWDPVTLLSKFENPLVVIVSQLFMLLATLSTNIAANVIAPSNAFSNLKPKKISFKTGGYITAIIGVLIAPWWLLDEISVILVFVSGLLGPVLGILLADYFLIRKKNLAIKELYKTDGIYAYGSSGYNKVAVLTLAVGVCSALIGYWVPALSFLYSMSCFTGFTTSFVLYFIIMKKTNKCL